MKKIYLIIIGILILFLIGIILLILRGSEDDWIKDSKGVWIKHGVPAQTPEKVKMQQDAINCAENLYNSFKNSRMEFNSQCLGKCGDYSVDIIHVPRSNEDDKIENQCSDFRNGLSKYFIELDKNGNVVRIVD